MCLILFCSICIFSSTFWEKKNGGVKQRNPQCAINSDNNDLLTKQSSGLHIYHLTAFCECCWRRAEQTVLCDMCTHTHTQAWSVLLCAYVCLCVPKPSQAAAQWHRHQHCHSPRPFNLFVILSACIQSPVCGITRGQQLITARVEFSSMALQIVCSRAGYKYPQWKLNSSWNKGQGSLAINRPLWQLC